MQFADRESSIFYERMKPVLDKQNREANIKPTAMFSTFRTARVLCCPTGHADDLGLWDVLVRVVNAVKHGGLAWDGFRRDQVLVALSEARRVDRIHVADAGVGGCRKQSHNDRIHPRWGTDSGGVSS